MNDIYLHIGSNQILFIARKPAEINTNIVRYISWFWGGIISKFLTLKYVGSFWATFSAQKIKILKPGSRDISQKLRQTNCLLFNFRMTRLTKTPILPNCQVQNSFFWYNCTFQPSNPENHTLSFWDISRDPGFRISISVQKMWPLDPT